MTTTPTPPEDEAVEARARELPDAQPQADIIEDLRLAAIDLGRAKPCDYRMTLYWRAANFIEDTAALKPDPVPAVGEVREAFEELASAAHTQGYFDGADDQREGRTHPDSRREGFQNWLSNEGGKLLAALAQPAPEAGGELGEPCTSCGGGGIDYQTELPCACGAPPGDGL